MKRQHQEDELSLEEEIARLPYDLNNLLKEYALRENDYAYFVAYHSTSKKLRDLYILDMPYTLAWAKKQLSKKCVKLVFAESIHALVSNYNIDKLDRLSATKKGIASCLNRRNLESIERSIEKITGVKGHVLADYFSIYPHLQLFLKYNNPVLYKEITRKDGLSIICFPR